MQSAGSITLVLGMLSFAIRFEAQRATERAEEQANKALLRAMLDRVKTEPAVPSACWDGDGLDNAPDSPSHPWLFGPYVPIGIGLVDHIGYRHVEFAMQLEVKTEA